MSSRGPARSLFLPLLLMALAPRLLPARDTPRPNVILIMTDDQGYGDLGCHGNKILKTPALDRLHANSVRLTNYHVDPTCSPTRSALLTGRYSSRTGVWHTIMGRSMMHTDEVTLAEVFGAGGYRTGCFGKWHLGDNYPLRPQDQGFHEVLVHGGGGVGQTPDFFGNDYFDDTYWHNGQVAKAANQVIVGLNIGAVAEALTLAKKAGADPARVRQALKGGFADSRILEVHGLRMIDGAFAPGGKCVTQRKDMDQALELARELGFEMPATALSRDLYDRIIDAGLGDLDHSALIKAIDPD